jgi:hypothetical protein
LNFKEGDPLRWIALFYCALAALRVRRGPPSLRPWRGLRISEFSRIPCHKPPWLALREEVGSRTSVTPSEKGDSHARRTPKKKAFSQQREEAMVRTPPRNSVFATIPWCGFRLIAFSNGCLHPVFQ